MILSCVDRAGAFFQERIVEKLLVVEDDRATRKALKQLFEPEGYSVELASLAVGGKRVWVRVALTLEQQLCFSRPVGTDQSYGTGARGVRSKGDLFSIRRPDRAVISLREGEGRHRIALPVINLNVPALKQ